MAAEASYMADWGSRVELEATEGGKQARYEAVRPGDVHPERLTDFEGSFFSDELPTTWTLVVENGKLLRRQWLAEDLELKPAFADGFVGDLSEGQLVVHYNRDEQQRVVSFDVASQMIRGMRFGKKQEGEGKAR
jgi:hypothetical protein